jgi:hypothetical protein
MFEESEPLTWFKALLFVVLAAIFSSGAFIGIKSHFNAKQREIDIKVYDSLLKGESTSSFSSHSPSLTLAKMSQASQLAKSGEIEKAMTLLEDAALKGTGVANFAARLMWMSLALDLPAEKLNKGKFNEHLSHFVRGKPPFFERAQLVAASMLIKEKNLDQAELILKDLRALSGNPLANEVNALWLITK